MVMWTMSDRAIPRSFRFMEGFGVHTFRFVDADGTLDVRQVPLEAEARPAVGGVERGGEDQRRRSRLPPPRPVGRHQQRRLPRVGARRAAVRRRVRRLVRLRRPRRHQDHPRGARAGPPGRPAGARPDRRQLLRRDRAGGVLHAERRPRASTSPTTRCCRAATSRTSTPSSSGSAGPNFTHLPGQRAEVPGRPLPAGRAHGDDQPGRAGELRAELVVGDAPGRARTPTGGFTLVRRAARGHQAAGALGTLRRPLQPGPPVPASARPRSSRRTSSTPSCSSCPSASSPRSARGWWPTCATSTRRSPPRSPTGSASTRSRRPSAPARAPITDLPPSPALSIVGNGPANFAGRKFGVLITDGTDAALLDALRKAAGRRGRAGRAHRPEDRRRHAQRRHARCRRTRRSTAARRCSTTPSPSSPPPTVPPRSPANPAAKDFVHRRPRPLQVHRLSPSVASPCSTRPASPHRSTTATCSSTRRRRSPRSSSAAETCATGLASCGIRQPLVGWDGCSRSSGDRASVS